MCNPSKGEIEETKCPNRNSLKAIHIVLVLWKKKWLAVLRSIMNKVYKKSKNTTITKLKIVESFHIRSFSPDADNSSIGRENKV